jgi:hypothetical protein
VLIDNITIDGTTYNGIGVWDDERTAPPRNVTIRDSTIDNVDSAYWWIVFYDGSDYTVENTEIMSTTNGDPTWIGVYDDVTGAVEVHNSKIDIFRNSDTDSSVSVDAERNWWGQSTGPTGGQLDGAGSTAIGHDPYCTVADCSATS